jgi:hypothetical protein
VYGGSIWRGQNVYFEGTPADSYVPGGSVLGRLMGTVPAGSEEPLT